MNNRRNKNNKLRYAEYYGLQEVYDDLYKRSVENENFKSLINIVVSDNNILLAYRNIKRNSGSLTPGIDGKTVKDIERLNTVKFLDIVKKRFEFYQPRKVKRTEIPKPNGKTRPLGIPSIWDRIAQKCILQVLEPICEAKFNPHSHGFRPNRSAEHAIADCAKKMNIIKMHYCVDIDIQAFFDEVWHTKLLRQMWTLGIRDKQVLVIIRRMLKAPVVLKDGTDYYPTKGTPQGGVLSPLLANINLNEFDWWVSQQWETKRMAEIKSQFNSTGTEHMGNHHRKMRSHTRLKEFYIVRYADDFKLFCHNKQTAEKLFHASTQWLKHRLRLPISEEKSKITNLRKESSEFLGFDLKLERKGKSRFVMHSHVSSKAIDRMKKELKEQIKEIKKSPNSKKTIRAIGIYNSKVIGMHGYYRIATHVNKDFKKIHYPVMLALKNRLSIDGLTKKGKYTGTDKGILNYVQSKNMRYLFNRPLVPISYVQHKNPMYLRNATNKYTKEGRNFIHKNQSAVSEFALKWLRSHPVRSGSIEFNDNRISLFVAQYGKCAVTGMELNVLDMHCHHKVPYSESKDDSYGNLTLVKPNVHILIHASQEETIRHYRELINPDDKQIKKINILRKLVKMSLYTHEANWLLNLGKHTDLFY